MKDNAMRAVVVTAPGRVELVELAVPKPGPYQALVRTDVAALCNATDGKLVAGRFPGVDTYPLVLDHESTGIVEAVGEKVRHFKVGDRVIGGLLFEFSDAKYTSGWGRFLRLHAGQRPRRHDGRRPGHAGPGVARVL